MLEQSSASAVSNSIARKVLHPNSRNVFGKCIFSNYMPVPKPVVMMNLLPEFSSLS